MNNTPYEVSIVVPTFNEIKNVQRLIESLAQALINYRWEVVFVDDDSPDMTWKLVKEIAAKDSRVRCIRRQGRRGLAGACIEGMASSAAPVVVVMDGDLQHDENIIPEMIATLHKGDLDLIVGSRFSEGGAHATGFSKGRASASNLAAFLSRRVADSQIQDLMSGFFALRREYFDEISGKLSTSGFKILLDILTIRTHPPRTLEIGYRFRERYDGDSKFDLRAMWDFFAFLVNKASGGIIPEKFVKFAVIGGLGLILHLVLLRILLTSVHVDFAASQTVATVIAMINNFFLNNALTYQNTQLRGFPLLKGLILFCIICSIGAIGNVGIASWIFAQSHIWWLAGVTGAVTGAVWNYAISSAFIWRK
jgi:dolichol-phosphate mannosyltransferase